MKKEAMFFEPADQGRLRCNLCSHHCLIADSGFGICGVRQNVAGTLYTLVYEEAIADHIDPIEKKPLYHFFPGSCAYSIATMGCNFRCGFCQNWQISQQSKREGSYFGGYRLTPDEVVERAKDHSCVSIAYTYTEPTAFFEYAFATAQLAKKAGIYNVFVTNGYMSPQALEAIQPYLDACNVDVKFFREDSYQKFCGARLEPVLASIRLMKKLGIWVEITTLIIPGLNDSTQELSDIGRFIKELDPDIPWHLSRFHPDYKFGNYPVTPLSSLEKAAQIGRELGLRFIYLGNVGAEGTSTHCYHCGSLLIERGYMSVEKIKMKGNRCPRCNTIIAGVFA